MDPWAVLGVPKGADAAALKRAKRAKQRVLHPDRQGGDELAMAEVNQAYDILTDPERLARFEQAGHDVPVTQPLEMQARNLVMAGFHQLLARAQPPPGGMVAAVREGILRERQDCEDAGPTIDKMLAATRRAQGAVRYTGVEGGDFLGGLFDQRIQELERMLETRTADLAKLDRALELLGDYEEDATPERTGAVRAYLSIHGMK